MYGYAEHIEITPEQILQKVTQQEIFEFILKTPFDFSSRYCSPLREDTKPGCRFEERPDGTIVFVDFGEKYLSGHTHRSCFGMVMDAFNVTITGAIRIICSEFGLSSNIKDYNLTIQIPQYNKDLSSKTPTDITFTEKFPSKADIIFWSQFLIKIEHLKEDNSVCISRFTIRSHKGFSSISVYKHGYAFVFVPKVKIYQPYKENYKWITNCDENCIGNHDNLPATGKELIIQKSYKDHRVLRNIVPELNVVWFQNEGCIPSLEILKNYTERFELVTIFFDNDEDGMKAAEKLVSVFNQFRENCARAVFLPKKRKHKKLFGKYLKDPGEFISKEGKEYTLLALKQIGLQF